MRILWHGFAAPWEPSGYGTQTGIWTTYLRDRGHQVAISVCHGLAGCRSQWEGMTVYPAPLAAHVHSLLRHHAADFKPDVTIVLADLWKDPQAMVGALNAVKGPVLAWMPIDLARHMSLGDVAVLKMLPRLRPVAMSEHGQRLLKSSAGIDAPCVPHAIDTFETWTPAPDRAAVRTRLGPARRTRFLSGSTRTTSTRTGRGITSSSRRSRTGSSGPAATRTCPSMRWPGCRAPPT